MTGLTLIGGPTALIEYGGLRWLTDPAFSPPGEYAGGLVKTTGPAIAADELGDIDVVLLSHDHHSDNLDPAGREFLPRARRVLTTVDGAARLDGNAAGLAPWEAIAIEGPDGIGVTVTAVPAQHGPNGTDHITGPVIGFVLAAELDTIYVSGDNASLDVVRQIKARVGAVDVAVLFAGAVQISRRFDGAYLTLSGARAARGGDDPRRPRGRAAAFRRLDAFHARSGRRPGGLRRQWRHRQAAGARAWGAANRLPVVLARRFPIGVADARSTAAGWVVVAAG
jgi:L-ascorbate metabolism protein UlaG (beta-lactamase superfamily)